MNMYFLTPSFQKPHSNSSYEWASRLFTIFITFKKLESKYTFTYWESKYLIDPTIVITVLQMRKPRHRSVKQLSQGPTWACDEAGAWIQKAWLQWSPHIAIGRECHTKISWIPLLKQSSVTGKSGALSPLKSLLLIWVLMFLSNLGRN